jgi:hypothetical protein
MRDPNQGQWNAGSCDRLYKFNTKFEVPSLLGYDAVLIGSYRRCDRIAFIFNVRFAPEESIFE